MKKVLGISGFMGSGKSLAGVFFEKKGFLRIDADEVVDDLYAEGEAGWRKIRDYFGPDYIRKDGRVNRPKLAKLVFGDANKIRILNGLIHPPVNGEIRRRIKACNKDFIAVEAAYFRERHLLEQVDAILWIDCDREILLNRALKRGISEKMFSQVIEVQEKPSRIDYFVDNNGDKAAFKAKLEEVYRVFTSGG
jgi:dephospho-CoA kinase